MTNTHHTSPPDDQTVDTLKYHSLIPSEDIDITAYREALNYALGADGIKNIGITGAYGAGKSSVLRSYEKWRKENTSNKQLSFIYISLAYFQPQQEADSHTKKDSVTEAPSAPQAPPEKAQRENTQNTQATAQKESAQATVLQENAQNAKRINHDIDTLEHKIINQLVHQIDPCSIARCDFSKKQNITFCLAVGITLSLVYVLFYALHVLFPAITARMQTSMPHMGFLFSPCAATLGFAVFLGIIGYWTWWFTKHGFRAWNITKLSIGSTSLEKKDSHDTRSVFDTHLSDVVYLFENCGANVVVFEDLDRFDINRIFKKLREINLCVNSCSNKIQFIYMVRDDMFANMERVKFFDYIIPIVPVITPHNSYDRMRELNWQDYLSGKFMKGISSYIDDMRHLYSINNDFKTYNAIFKSKKEKDRTFYEKLFSMIVYKNFFPHAFSEDQYLRGVVTRIVNKKKSLCETIENEYRKQIDDIERKIKNSDTEHLENLDELYYVSVDSQKILNLIKNHEQYILQSTLQISNKELNWRTLEGKKKIVEYALENPHSLENVTVHHGGHYLSDYFDMTTLLGINSFKSRKQAIENKASTARVALTSKIFEIRKDIDKIKAYSLCDIYDKYPDELNKIIKESSIANDSKNGIIQFLIKNDYIGETYKDYMTYFVGMVLTGRDYHFKLSVQERTPLSLDYTIDNPETVIEELRDYFSHKAILNVSLLRHFQDNNACLTGNELYALFMKCLCSEPEIFVKFAANSFVDYKKLIASANTVSHSFWQTYKQTEGVTNEDFLRYGLTSLDVHDAGTLDLLNKEQAFEKALLEDPNFLPYLINTPDAFHAKLKNITKNILHFGKCIAHLAYDSSIAPLFNAIYEKRLFALKFANICLLLRVKYIVTDDETIHGAMYSTICSQPDTPLAKEIGEYMNIFAKVLLEEPGVVNHGIYDKEKDAIAFLKHPDIAEKWKNAYAFNLKTEVQDLRDYISLPQEGQDLAEADLALLDLLCTHNCIEHTSKNIVTYFILRNKAVDDWLVQYINSFDSAIELQNDMFEQDEQRSNFFNIIMSMDSINFEQYKEIIKSLHFYSTIPDAKLRISKEKVDFLLMDKVWRMYKDGDKSHNNSKVITIIREDYRDSLTTLVSTYENEFMACILENPELIDRDDRITLQSANISDDNKIKIIEEIEGTINLSETDFSQKVREYIIQNKFDVANLKDIIQIYCDEDATNKAIILNQVTNNIDDIITYNIPLCYTLLMEVLSEKLDDERKVSLLLQSIVGLSSEKMLLATRQITTFADLHLLRYGKQPKIPVSPLAKKLLTVLQEQKIVSSFKENESMYIVNGTKRNLAK